MVRFGGRFGRSPWSADLPDGKKLLAEVDAASGSPDSFTMDVTLTTTSPGDTDRVMVLNNSHKKGFGTFLEIQAPARSKGTRMLTQEGSLWLFNPKSGSTKPVRLASRDSFQGSSFSNSDVSKTSFTEDYDGVTEGEDTIDTAEFGPVKTWRLRATANNPEAAYGYIVMWVRQGDLLPLKFDYYTRRASCCSARWCSASSKLWRAGYAPPRWRWSASTKRDRRPCSISTPWSKRTCPTACST